MKQWDKSQIISTTTGCFAGKKGNKKKFI